MGESEYVPSRRELHRMIRNQGWIVITVGLVLFVIGSALLRKGVLTWSDLGNVVEDASG